MLIIFFFRSHLMFPFRICDPDTNLCVQDNGEIGKELPLVTGSSDVSQLWIYGGLD